MSREPDTKSSDGPTGLPPLHDAAAKGDEAAVKALLAAGADPNATRADDDSAPLHYAAENGHETVVRVLLAAGADPNAKEKDYSFDDYTGGGPRWGHRPLHYAAQNGHEAVVRVLLAAGADPNVNGPRINGYWTPLHLAASEGLEAVARVLLEAGADPKARDVDGNRPSRYVKKKKHPALAELLRAYAKRPRSRPS